MPLRFHHLCCLGPPSKSWLLHMFHFHFLAELMFGKLQCPNSFLNLRACDNASRMSRFGYCISSEAANSKRVHAQCRYNGGTDLIWIAGLYSRLTIIPKDFLYFINNKLVTAQQALHTVIPVFIIVGKFLQLFKFLILFLRVRVHVV